MSHHSSTRFCAELLVVKTFFNLTYIIMKSFDGEYPNVLYDILLWSFYKDTVNKEFCCLINGSKSYVVVKDVDREYDAMFIVLVFEPSSCKLISHSFVTYDDVCDYVLPE